jgi:hypothetical protein
VRPDWRTTLAPPNHPQGTLYGGRTGLPTSPNPDAPLELSGSLTGLVLAQGNPELRPAEERSRTRKVVLTLSLVVMILIAVGVMVAYFSGDILSSLIGTAGKP